ncbi:MULTISPECIES: hypothetical protein [unclassified Legionella]|uniref:hypothetical protein n=1 Tax=unclassified Legionella TaxID=2622702 RepID=UPI001054F0F3|nr:MULTISPECIES: hypothetical protein [unclassified Legionella]MDI9818527.1 hypothetical protein [Legionella sp. PL877]
MKRLILLILMIMPTFGLFAKDTILKLYQPFGEAIQQAPIVIQREASGECWQQSQRIKREDAWRCMAEGKIYDPCFVRQFGSHQEAVCPQSPWVGSSVKINMSFPVDNSQHVELNMAETYPWAIELTTGEKCQAVDEGQVYDGLPVRYQCDNQVLLLGHVQRCKTQWSMLQHTSNGVSTALVERAWF